MSKNWRERILTIPAGEDFLSILVRSILDGSAPFCGAARAPSVTELADWTFLLPTRRAVRALGDIFLRHSENNGLFLPKLLVLGDLEAENEATSQRDDTKEADGVEQPWGVAGVHERLFFLTRMVQAINNSSISHALVLARSLDQLLTAAELAEIEWKLDELVPDNLAEHWKKTIEFLRLIVEYWPQHLRDSGKVDAMTHRNQQMAAWAEALPTSGMSAPVVVAGSTGSIPATARLMEHVLQYPSGWVLLPGLDNRLCAQQAQQLTSVHPQHGMTRLLRHLGIASPAEVKVYPGAAVDGVLSSRRNVVAAAMVDAEQTHHWHEWARQQRDNIDEMAACLRGVSIITADNEHQEAGAIACAVADAIAAQAATARIIVPDRSLAQRIVSAFHELGISVEDTAGQPYALTQAGRFLLLLLAVARSDFAAVELIALLQHPWLGRGGEAGARGGEESGTNAAAGGIDFDLSVVHQFEYDILRSPRLAPALAGYRAHVAYCTKPGSPQAKSYGRLLDALERGFAPLMGEAAAARAGIASWVERLMLVADNLTGQSLALPPHEDTVMGYVQGLAQQESSHLLGEGISLLEFSYLLAELLAGETVYPAAAGNPIALYGRLEARLLGADLTVIAGCNEGSWPPRDAANPWLSSTMERKLGILRSEQHLGLVSHDFAQAACGGQLIISRSRTVDGSPAAASRWLVRLLTVIAGIDASLEASLHDNDSLARARAMNEAQKETPRETRPAPHPPLALRPRAISASDVDKLVRDPYSVYAARVLGLRKLRPIADENSAADYGTLVHQILSQCCVEGRFQRDNLQQAADKVLRAGRYHPATEAKWRMQFQHAIDWIVENLSLLPPAVSAAGVIHCAKEVLAQCQLADVFADAPLTVRGRIDRIDVWNDADGTRYACIVDYKTGRAPTQIQENSGFANQLPLYAHMVREGAVEGVTADNIMAAYVKLPKRGKDGGWHQRLKRGRGQEVTPLGEDMQRLWRVLRSFGNEQTAYTPRRAMEKQDDNSDYDLLSRRWEWDNGI